MPRKERLILTEGSGTVTGDSTWVSLEGRIRLWWERRRAERWHSRAAGREGARSRLGACVWEEQGGSPLGQVWEDCCGWKTGRQVSMRLCLLGDWMISGEGLCPVLAWGSSFWHEGKGCVAETNGWTEGDQLGHWCNKRREVTGPSQAGMWKTDNGEWMGAKVTKIWSNVEV